MNPRDIVRLSKQLWCGWIVFGFIESSLGQRGFVNEFNPEFINSNSVTFTIEVSGNAPEAMAVLVQREPSNPEKKDDSFDKPNWIPFQTNLLIDLGAGDGERTIFFTYRDKGQKYNEGWHGRTVKVQSTTPILRFVNPSNSITSQSIIQLQGLTSQRLAGVWHDRFNQKGEQVVANEGGSPDSNYTGGPPFGLDDHNFSFLDVRLDPGTNTFVVRGVDQAGNWATNRVAIVFTTEGDKTPPHVKLHWPVPGTRIPVTGKLIEIWGQSDDPTARFEGSISANGIVNYISGGAGRAGAFSYEYVPLSPGSNHLQLTLTDLAGNSVTTNLVIHGVASNSVIMNWIDPLTLSKSFVDLTGSIDPPNQRLWINGVSAAVASDGGWRAGNVPVNSPSSATAMFEVLSTPLGKSDKPKQSIIVQMILNTNAVTLNAATPACGDFQLMLISARMYALSVSSNLTRWRFISTNYGRNMEFNYQDPNTANSPCRFFRVVPL